MEALLFFVVLLTVRSAHAAHDDVADQLGDRSGAGTIRGNLLEALDERSRHIRMRKELDQFHADIAYVDVRPDDDIGAAGHFRFAFYFLRGDARIDCSVQLELAVDGKVRTKLVRNANRLADIVYHRMLHAAVR